MPFVFVRDKGFHLSLGQRDSRNGHCVFVESVYAINDIADNATVCAEALE